MDEELKAQHFRTTVSARACIRPCFLHHADLASDSASSADAALIDGHDTNGDVVLDLAAYEKGHDTRFFDPPLRFKEGLFVSVGSNVKSVTVQFSE